MTKPAPIAEQHSHGTTGRQLELLQEIVSWVDAHGDAPTVRELAAMIGTNIGDIQCKLARLKRDGVVDWDEGRSRTLRVTCTERQLIHLLG